MTCSENCPFGQHVFPTWPPCVSPRLALLSRVPAPRPLLAWTPELLPISLHSLTHSLCPPLASLSLSAHENGATMDAAAKLHGRRVPVAPSHHSRSHMYCRLHLIMLRSAHTLTQALGHWSTPSPWPTDQAPGPLPFHRLQPPST
jgi:hypothetical protein